MPLQHLAQSRVGKSDDCQQEVLGPDPVVTEPECFMLGSRKERDERGVEVHDDTALARRQGLQLRRPSPPAYLRARSHQRPIHVAGQGVCLDPIRSNAANPTLRSHRSTVQRASIGTVCSVSSVQMLRSAARDPNCSTM
jgi:hypothetical protein